LVRDRELAEVVEEARRADALDVAIGQADRPAELRREIGDELRRPAGPAGPLGQRPEQVIARRLERAAPDLRRLVAGPHVDGRLGEAAVLAERSMRLHLVAAALLRLVQRTV